MKKFECLFCANPIQVYCRYYHAYSSRNYYLGYCIDHLDCVPSENMKITYEEFIAAKAMEAL